MWYIYRWFLFWYLSHLAFSKFLVFVFSCLSIVLWRSCSLFFSSFFLFCFFPFCCSYYKYVTLSLIVLQFLGFSIFFSIILFYCGSVQEVSINLSLNSLKFFFCCLDWVLLMKAWKPFLNFCWVFYAFIFSFFLQFVLTVFISLLILFLWPFMLLSFAF